MKKKYLLSSVMVMLIAGFLLVAFQTQKVNITGKWNLHVETPAGGGDPVLILKQENDTLITGTYTGLFGETDLEGTIYGNKIDIKVPTDMVTMQYQGTIENETMKGKVKYNLSEIGEGTFTGTLVK